MTLSKPIQYQMMVDKFDSHYFLEMKGLTFSGYNNKKFIDGQMVMLLIAINKLTNTET